MATNVIGFAGLGVGILAFLCAILALALPYWITADFGAVEMNSGLWRTCTETSGSSNCADSLTGLMDDREDKLKAVRAMVVLGFICTVAALVVFILFLFVLKDKKIFGFIAGGVSIAAGLFLMIAMAIFVDEFDNDNVDLGAAFALDIIAWISAWIAGALMFVGAIKGGDGA